MIKVENISKSFGKHLVLKNISCTLNRGSVVGIVGINGAGKSTLLRIICGVLKGDVGIVNIDGEDVFDNPRAKQKLAFVPDEPYFPNGANLIKTAKLYISLYNDFDMAALSDYAKTLAIDTSAPLSSLSKGQRRQCAIILALSTNPDFLILDETFDGLDPIAKNTVRSLIFDKTEKGMCAVMTTHSLRELEDTCDKLFLLKDGTFKVTTDIASIKNSYFKIQTAFETPLSPEILNGITVVSLKNHGKIYEICVKGDKDEITARINQNNPLIFELIPLSLEEIFQFEAGGDHIDD